VCWDYLVYGHLISAWQVAGFALIVLASLGVNLDWRLTVEKLYNR
jgi:drug/metabolite transporter (DMT)-like permease